MKKVLAFLILWTSLFTALCQEEKAEVKPGYYFGFSLGETQGSGFSFRYQPSRWAFQAAVLPLFMRENRQYITTGFSVFYTLEKRSRFELLSYFSTAMNFANFSEPYFNPSENDVIFVSVNPGIHSSMGFGMNFNVIKDKLTLSVQNGYGIRNLTDDARSMFSTAFGVFYKF